MGLVFIMAMTYRLKFPLVFPPNPFCYTPRTLTSCTHTPVSPKWSVGVSMLCDLPRDVWLQRHPGVRPAMSVQHVFVSAGFWGGVGWGGSDLGVPVRVEKVMKLGKLTQP